MARYEVLTTGYLDGRRVYKGEIVEFPEGAKVGKGYRKTNEKPKAETPDPAKEAAIKDTKRMRDRQTAGDDKLLS